MIQMTIVILIVVLTVALTLRHYYHRLTGKTTDCNCCQKTGGAECHCCEHQAECKTQ